MGGFVDVATGRLSQDIPQTPNRAYVYVYNSGTAAIAKGDLVLLDVAANQTDGATAVKQSDVVDSAYAFGIADDAIPVGKPGRVIVWGEATVKATGAIAAGALVQSAAAGAVAAPVSPAAGKIVGVAVAAASGGTVRLFVNRA